MTNFKIEKEFARRAFYNVSFDPDKRGERFVEDFEEVNKEIINLCNQYEVDPNRLLEKHYKLATAYLSAESRCASAAVVGFSKFPVARMEKRHKQTQNHLERLVYFRDNIEKTLKRITRKTETQEDKKTRWIKKIEFLKLYQEMMKDVNSMVRKGKIKEAEEKYNLKLKPNCWGNIGFESYELRNKLANIKRLEEQVKQIDNLRSNELAGFSFNGGTVEFDKEEIRWNIFFDEKPNEEIRSKIKARGFKWSPRRGAWTRGAKTISVETIKLILGD